jgi:hypothetical protein
VINFAPSVGGREEDVSFFAVASAVAVAGVIVFFAQPTDRSAAAVSVVVTLFKTSLLFERRTDSSGARPSVGGGNAAERAIHSGRALAGLLGATCC